MKIDILVKPNESTAQIERLIQTAAVAIKIQVQVTKTSNFIAYSNLSINPSQTPMIIINGNLEFAGRIPDLDLLKKKMAEVLRRQ